MTNPLSFSSVKLNPFTKDGAGLKLASGFVVEAVNQSYLITTRYVVSGGESSTHGVHTPVIQPYTLKTSLYIYVGASEGVPPFSRGAWRKITIQLYDDNNTPRWIGGQANQRNQTLADVVALPLEWVLDSEFHLSKAISREIVYDNPGFMGSAPNYWAKICAIPVSAIDTDVNYDPPDTVYVVGHPSNWAPAGADKSSPAFWRTSSIASEPNVPGMIQESGFYIDPSAPEGMTGSPVVGMKNDRVKLLGVYSDTSTAEFGANAGLVWDAARIKHLLGLS